MWSQPAKNARQSAVPALHGLSMPVGRLQQARPLRSSPYEVADQDWRPTARQQAPNPPAGPGHCEVPSIPSWPEHLDREALHAMGSPRAAAADDTDGGQWATSRKRCMVSPSTRPHTGVVRAWKCGGSAGAPRVRRLAPKPSATPPPSASLPLARGRAPGQARGSLGIRPTAG